MKKRNKTNIVRGIIQGVVFLFVFLGSSAAALAKKGVVLPLMPFEVHGVCPFGGVETAYTLITTGGYIQKTQPSSLILLVIVGVITLLFGAVFCGWLCPFGTLQEFIGKIGKRLFPKVYNRLPPAIDKPLRFMRYLVLVVLIVLTARVGKLVFDSFDPYSALMNIFSDEIALGGLIFLAVVVLLSLFIERPFCKYFCPFGALLGLVSLISPFRPRRDTQKCIQCKKCDKACPMNITISSKKNVRNPQCISCYRCVSGEACPVSDTLNIATPNVLTPAKKGEGHEA